MKRVLVGFLVAVGVAAVSYFSVIGCCSVLAAHRGGYAAGAASLSRKLGLSGEQRSEVDRLEKEFIAKKRSACDSLCRHRTRLAQLLGQPEPDRAALSQVVEQIGREQTILEMATADHLLAVRKHLNPSQRGKMNEWMVKQMEEACKMTACGSTPGCAVREREEKS